MSSTFVPGDSDWVPTVPISKIRDESIPDSQSQWKRSAETHGAVHLQKKRLTKKNEIMPFSATQMDLEMIIVSEISQTEEVKYHLISLRRGI